MSIFNLMKRKSALSTKEQSPEPAPSFTDVMGAAAANQYDVENANARDRLIQEGRTERNKLFLKTVGINLRNAISDNTLSENKMKFDRLSKNLRSDEPEIIFGKQVNRENFDKFESLKSAHIKSKRDGDPDNPVWKTIKTDEEILEGAVTTAKQSSARYQDISSRAGTFDTFVGSLVGGMGASLADPANVLSMIPTAGLGYKAVTAAASAVKPLLNKMGAEFAENSMQELGISPEVKKWKEEIGEEYGLWDLVTNMFVGGAAGAGIAGLGGLVGKGITKASKKLGDKNLRVEIEKHSDKLSPKEKRAAKTIERQAHYDEARPENTPIEKHQDAIEATAKALEEGKSVDIKDLEVKDSDIILNTGFIGDDVADQTIMSNDPMFRAKQGDIPSIKDSIARGEAWRLTVEDPDGNVKVIDFFESKEKIQKLMKGELVTGFEPISDIPFVKDGVVEFKRPKENASLTVSTENEISVMSKELEGTIGLLVPAKEKLGENEIAGEVLWWSKRDGNGIVVDSKGNEIYVDSSVIGELKELTPKSRVALEINPKTKDVRAGHKVRALEPEAKIKEAPEWQKRLSSQDPKEILAAIESGKGKLYKEIEAIAGNRVIESGDTTPEGLNRLTGKDEQVFIPQEAPLKKEGNIRGEVLWFDKSSGEGMLVDPKTGEQHYVHYSAIEGQEGLKNLTQGQKVEFQLYENLYSKQVDSVSRVEGRSAEEVTSKLLLESKKDLEVLNKEIENGNAYRISIEGEDGKIFVVDKIIKDESIESYAKRSGDVVLDSKKITTKLKEESGVKDFIKESPLENKEAKAIIVNELDQMSSEVAEAIKVSNNSFDPKTGDFTSRQNLSTFPEWYQSLNLKNKDELAKIIKRGKGVRYDRLVAIAVDRLERGHSSKIIGDIAPSDEYRMVVGKEPLGVEKADITVVKKSKLELDNGFTERKAVHEKVQKEFNERLGIAEVESPTAEAVRLLNEGYHAPEKIQAEERSFADLVREDPDAEMGDGRTLKEVVEDMETDEKGLEALTSCSLKGSNE